jgi:serine acetyltransferase
VKERLQILYLTTVQINALIRWSVWLAKFGIIGRACSIWCDNLMLALYGIEVASRSLAVQKLVVGHSTGVVLGGNGIRCSGTLHVSSGVVFARRYSDRSKMVDSLHQPMFIIDGDLTVGANSVLLGPLTIKGPVIIGALSLVTADIIEPGIYVGCPARKVRDIV